MDQNSDQRTRLAAHDDIEVAILIEISQLNIMIRRSCADRMKRPDCQNISLRTRIFQPYIAKSDIYISIVIDVTESESALSTVRVN